MGDASAIDCRFSRAPFGQLLRAAKGAADNKELGMRRLRRDRLGAEDRREQAREPGVEVLAPELGQLAGPLSLLPDDPGFPEDPEMMSHGRLGDPELDRSTRAGLIAPGQPEHDLEPLRIAERVANARQLDPVPPRAMQIRW